MPHKLVSLASCGISPFLCPLLLFPPFAFPHLGCIVVSLQFLNGDALRETFTHTERVGSTFLTVVGDVHLCLTILLFTYVVINCTIAIVEEAFFNTRTIDAQQLVRAARLLKIYTRQTVEELTTAADEEEAAVRRARKGEGAMQMQMQTVAIEAAAAGAGGPSEALIPASASA